jgi:[phosphatase 2A protein]-leucine-carboxy methyltransferase
MMDPNADYRIIATAEDAILAKHATAKAKYYRDPFVEAFAHAATIRQQHKRRPFQPIIKRGTHARVCCMDRAIAAFLKAHANTKSGCEIVVLGAGKDTSYFRFFTKSIMGMEEFIKDRKLTLPNVHWYEVDHPTVIQEKANTIQGSPMLSQCCPNFKPTAQGFSSSSSAAGSGNSSQYHLVASDLRDSPEELLQRLSLNPKRPTLFLLECVFMYMPNESTRALLTQLAAAKNKEGGAAPPSWIAMYEPILGSDAFGNMMEQNLVQARVAGADSCLLQTRTLEAQLEKLVQAGFAGRAVGCDMWSAYESIVTPEQRQLANKAEFLDEIEEWMLIMRHYCFVVATTSSAKDDTLTEIGPDSKLGFVQGKCKVMAKES